MRQLVFIDDDQTELTEFAQVVGRDYHYRNVHWPHESAKLFNQTQDQIFL
jgi:hypothetical protein